MSSKLFLKVTNFEECHNEYQYKDNLNKLEGKFNDNPKDSCVPGRLYFCKPKHIHKYFDYGVNLREIYLPVDNPDFKMIKDPSGKKYGANMIILGKKRSLKDPDTWEFMNTIGVKFEKSSLSYIISKNYIECFKYLINIGVAINTSKYNCLLDASYYGRLEIVKYLMPLENNKEIIFEALCQASFQNKIEVLKYLLGEIKIRFKSFKYSSSSSKKKIINDFKHLCEDLLFMNCRYGNLQIVEYLISLGANVHAHKNKSIRSACKYGHLNVVKFLVEKGANIYCKNNHAVKLAYHGGHEDIVKYLIECDVDIREIENGADIGLILKKIPEDTVFNGHIYEWKVVQFPSCYDRLKKYAIISNN
ncbi:ankyrin repeat protein [Acanthamoeba polyphaga mimivirus]|uniref:Ankyrin repeat protein n=1 Tax=Acanthamoeba polyphaga mimivirus TaxID=212035 RepID=A0A2L2DKS1_MIMIV|nr:ankyrin repeat protein [Acanthamoeba polyphaga mimivirus]